ncbi:hypothetical protein AB1L42_03710 [Thalassoglobus sp. JC818]|uniref:hypothetical protein n=1 Tax=Thalassoglobus sp. JC818 TaxID=3232136 RepID=UPI003459932F
MASLLSKRYRNHRSPVHDVQLVLVFVLLVLLTVPKYATAQAITETPETTNTSSSQYCEIQFLDAETDRPIPLITATTTHGVRYVSDNQGRIAYYEPGHDGQTVFFELETHGYRVPVDGFGTKGVRVKIKAGASRTIRLRRDNIAERLYRNTGADLLRDSILLEKTSEVPSSPAKSGVVGQDSVQVAKFQNQLYWFWGDTSRLSYPLGMFRTAGATSPLPEQASWSPDQGIELTYFENESGFVRPMVKFDDPEGVVWIEGVCVVKDHKETEKLVASFSQRRDLANEIAHGMLTFDSEEQVFRRTTSLSKNQRWQLLKNHPVQVNTDGKEWLYSGIPIPVTRVPASYESVMNPNAYESWSCIDTSSDSEKPQPRRNQKGKLDWQWQNSPPVNSQMESEWLENGQITANEAWYLPEDAYKPGRRIRLHTGSVYWNEFRGQWVMIASEFSTRPNAPSHLGEIWYSEALRPEGPYKHAIKILTHHRQSFYNSCQHPFLSEDSGRVIYFEGTYTNMFTSAPATPRYNYNQIMYRLDLQDPQIENVFGPPAG